MSASIHGIFVSRIPGDLPNGIPVFKNLSVLIEPEEIHGDVLFITRPDLIGMQSDKVPFSHTWYELNGFLR